MMKNQKGSGDGILAGFLLVSGVGYFAVKHITKPSEEEVNTIFEEAIEMRSEWQTLNEMPNNQDVKVAKIIVENGDIDHSRSPLLISVADERACLSLARFAGRGKYNLPETAQKPEDYREEQVECLNSRGEVVSKTFCDNQYYSQILKYSLEVPYACKYEDLRPILAAGS